MGNYQGDITVRSLLTDENRVIERCTNAHIIHVEPARDGRRLLLVAKSGWGYCGLFIMNSYECKYVRDGVERVEISWSLAKTFGTSRLWFCSGSGLFTYFCVSGKCKMFLVVYALGGKRSTSWKSSFYMSVVATMNINGFICWYFALQGWSFENGMAFAL